MAMNATYGSFTSNGQASATVEGNYFDYCISGTFVGTVAIQVQDLQGNWVTRASHTTVLHTVASGWAHRKCRLVVTAYTSGTIIYDLVGSRFASIGVTGT